PLLSRSANDSTSLYLVTLHAALPYSRSPAARARHAPDDVARARRAGERGPPPGARRGADWPRRRRGRLGRFGDGEDSRTGGDRRERKSARLNSSYVNI